MPQAKLVFYEALVAVVFQKVVEAIGGAWKEINSSMKSFTPHLRCDMNGAIKFTWAFASP